MVAVNIYNNGKNFKGYNALTIATPYLNDDPSGWANALINHPLAGDVEIIFVDDGTNDDALDAKLCAIIDAWPGPARRFRYNKNQGRSNARNVGIEQSQGEYILFIDADMVPINDDFLDKYLDIIKKRKAAVVFGGFETKGDPNDRDKLLHHDLSQRADCLPAIYRAERGAYAVASNNLLARRQLLIDHPFDHNFKGWGWEDTEWALRVTNLGYGLIHIDNPAMHIGLDGAKTMLKKYREAAPNLKLMVTKHPEVERFLSVKIARTIGNLPFHKAFRPIASFITIDKYHIMPLALRRMAIKYWRASWAAETLQENKI